MQLDCDHGTKWMTMSEALAHFRTHGPDPDMDHFKAMPLDDKLEVLFWLLMSLGVHARQADERFADLIEDIEEAYRRVGPKN